MLSHHLIPLGNLPRLEEELADLNKRAARLKLEPLSMDVGDPWDKNLPRWSEELDKRIDRIVPHVWISLEGESITLSGWTFVATLHHAGEGETIIAAVPGETVPVAYRWSNATCDHCSTLRRRNATYLVRHEDGTVKQVGRSCLRDFLPMADRDPETMARWAELLGGFMGRIGSLDEEYNERGARREPAWSLREVLAATSVLMRREGWRSRSAAKERGGAATADLVETYLWGDGGDKETRGWIHKMGPVTEEDAERAQKVLDWAEEALVPERGEMSDYEHNLGVVSRLGIVRGKTLGIACSMIRAWQRATQTEELKRQEARVEQEWLTQDVGARVELKGVKVVKAMEMENSGYGASCLVKMDHEGRMLTWFASASTFWPKEGETLQIRATIKAKKEYRGAKETIVTRVKVYDCVSEDGTMTRSFE